MQFNKLESRNKLEMLPQSQELEGFPNLPKMTEDFRDFFLLGIKKSLAKNFLEIQLKLWVHKFILQPCERNRGKVARKQSFSKNP